MSAVSCSTPSDIDVSKNWKFTIENYSLKADTYSDYSSADYDDTSWEKLESLPAPITLKRDKYVIWLRKKIIIPEIYKGRDLSLFLGKIWDQETTFLNGIKIGTNGREYPQFHSAWNNSIEHYLPDNLIRYGEENTIAIRQFTNQQSNFNGAPFIGESLKVKSYNFKETFLAEYIPMIFGVITFILALGVFVLFIAGKIKNRLLLLFGVISLLWSIASCHFWFPSFGPIPWNVQDQMFYIIIAVILTLIYFYLEIALDVKIKASRIIIVSAALVTIVLSITASDTNPITGWRFDIMGPIGLIGQIQWGMVLVFAIMKKNKDAKIYMIGYLFFVLTLVHDALMMNRLVMSSFFLTPIGYPGFMISFLIVQIQRVIKLASDLQISGALIESKNRNLKEIFQSVTESTDDLISISITVKDTTRTLGEEMQTQAAGLEETSAVIEQISSSVESVADNTAELDNQIHEINRLAEQYGSSLQEITGAAQSAVNLGEKSRVNSGAISEKLEIVKQNMIKLKDSSAAIEDIASIINDISEKTNLLSLNAAIEAARAGDHGRGFAVVADEIGKLADNAVEQAKTIQKIVKTIVAEIENETAMIIQSTLAVSNINETVATVNNASNEILRLCKNQEEMTRNLYLRMTAIAEGSGQIKISTFEQKNAMSEVVITLETLTSITDKVNSSSDQMIKISETLSHRIAILNKIIIDS
jgi:methyl-accepting chemotaxis protein